MIYLIKRPTFLRGLVRKSIFSFRSEDPETVLRGSACCLRLPRLSPAEGDRFPLLEAFPQWLVDDEGESGSNVEISIGVCRVSVRKVRPSEEGT